jgi:hypothetical protein
VSIASTARAAIAATTSDLANAGVESAYQGYEGSAQRTRVLRQPA